MALCKRLIARLDIKGSRLIKGVRFEGLRVLGDPCEAALRYAEAGADELLYVDAVASLYGRNGLADLLRRTSREVFIPITAGGGVRSVADAAELLAAGADKIAVNTAALQRPELITELAETFGKQCVVISVQARQRGSQGWEAMGEAGREKSGRDVLDWIIEAQSRGAGELLLTSVDRDGTCKGGDIDLFMAVKDKISIPIIAGGGFCKSKEIVSLLSENHISSISIGACLHYNRITLNDIKDSSDKRFNVRREISMSDRENPISQPLSGHKIGIIDYGMGNQQSLKNAFLYLGASVELSGDRNILNSCSVIVLPGVGSFPQGMKNLRARGLDGWIYQTALNKKPIIGICLGMQLLFEEGEEFKETKGLSILKGRVTRLPDDSKDKDPTILPHVGWNLIYKHMHFSGNTSFSSTESNYHYFVHSYSATGTDKSIVEYMCTYSDYEFVAGVRSNNIVGFQFHPERSGLNGLSLLGETCCSLLDQYN